VARVRAELESTSDIPKLDETRGRDGKTRTAKPKRTRRTTAAPGTAPVEQTAPAEPSHPGAELMAAVTGTTHKITRATSGEDEFGRKLMQILSVCGVDHTPGKIEDGEVHEATAAFLPLRGVRAIIELAGCPGPRPSEKCILHVWARANGTFVPPLNARRRARKAKRR